MSARKFLVEFWGVVLQWSLESKIYLWNNLQNSYVYHTHVIMDMHISHDKYFIFVLFEIVVSRVMVKWNRLLCPVLSVSRVVVESSGSVSDKMSFAVLCWRR